MIDYTGRVIKVIEEGWHSHIGEKGLVLEYDEDGFFVWWEGGGSMSSNDYDFLEHACVLVQGQDVIDTIFNIKDQLDDENRPDDCECCICDDGASTREQWNFKPTMVWECGSVGEEDYEREELSEKTKFRFCPFCGREFEWQ